MGDFDKIYIAWINKERPENTLAFKINTIQEILYQAIRYTLITIAIDNSANIKKLNLRFSLSDNTISHLLFRHISRNPVKHHLTLDRLEG